MFMSDCLHICGEMRILWGGLHVCCVRVNKTKNGIAYCVAVQECDGRDCVAAGGRNGLQVTRMLMGQLRRVMIQVKRCKQRC